MINMTSFANFDFFDKQNEITAVDQSASESKAKEFDELFTGYIAASGGNAPVQPNAEFVGEEIKFSSTSPEKNEITPDESQFVETPNLPALAPQDVLKQSTPAEIKLELTPVEQTLIKESAPEATFKFFADGLSVKDTSRVSPIVTQTPLNSDVPELKLTADSTIKSAEQTKANPEIVAPAENSLPSLEEKSSPEPSLQPDVVFENQIRSETTDLPENQSQPKTNDFEFKLTVEQTENTVAVTENIIADTENKIADSALPKPESKMQVEIKPIKQQKVSTPADALDVKVVIENKIKEKEVSAAAIKEISKTENAIKENAVVENAVLKATAPIRPNSARNEIFSEETKAFNAPENPSDLPVNQIPHDAEKPTIVAFENQINVEPIAVQFDQPVKPNKEISFELKIEVQSLKTASIETKMPVDIELETPLAGDLEIPAVTESNTTGDNKLNIPAEIEAQTSTRVELKGRANTDLKTPADVELKPATVIEGPKTPNDSQIKTLVELKPSMPTNTEFNRPANADLRTPPVTELYTPADIKPKTSTDSELKTPLDIKLKTLVDIDLEKPFVIESKTDLGAEFVNPKADIDLIAPTDDKLSVPADAALKTLPETESVELKTPTEVKSGVSEKAPLLTEKLISPESKTASALANFQTPITTGGQAEPVKPIKGKKEPRTLITSGEQGNSDVLPVIQTPTGKFKKNVIASSVKLETFSSAANVPVKFRNLFNLSSPNTVAQDVVPALPVSSDVLPAAAENPTEIENLPVNDLPKIFSKILNSTPQENTKAVIELTTRAAETVDLQLAGEQIESQKTQPAKPLNNSFAVTEAAELEKPIKLTDNSPAPFFERLSMAVKTGTQIAETTPPLDVQRADVLEQIEKPLLEAVTLTAKVDEPEILKLRLRPAELGMVEVKLEKTDANTIKIQFQTQTDATQQILAENFDQLKTTLENSGWRVEPMEIVSHQFASSGSEPQQRDSQPRQRDAENKFGESTSFGSDADETSDSADDQSDRLLSVRA